MSSAPRSGGIPSHNPNPKFNNSKNPKNVHHIAGIPVEFPYKPYGTQLSFMYRVISTLDRAQKDGHCHALLESPTGTGKSLSLLCSTLAWQQKYKTDNIKSILSQSKPDPEAITDPLGHGGGFIPATQPSSVPPSSVSESPEHSANSKNKKKKLAPTIYYASRTHSQISQVIHEYRKTSYRVPMAILASRKHYCTNPQVSKENIDEECKLLLSNREEGCSEFKNMHKVKCHPSLQRGGCHEPHDIEDLVKIGQVVRGCAYYAARSMADDAQLVFCPYSYIINPVIRGAMDVDIKGAIIVLDEAHNIEDIARESGSVDLEEDALFKLQTELHQLKLINADIYQPLYEMSMNLLSWIAQAKSKLEETHESKHYLSSWTGDKALRQLQEANISQKFFPVLLECAMKAIKAASDTEPEVLHLSGMSVITLEGLFSSLTYFFSRDGSHIFDYHLALQRYFKKDEKNAFGSWTCSLSLWCLNPSVVFRDIADLSLSVILSSGTLSPTNSFSSELGVQFGNYLEAPHVIDVKSQVWSAVISHGPGNCRLDASYKTANQYAFQDSLGKSLEEIFKIVPGGCLIFFPSYKLMENLCDRWRNTGQWSQLKARKPLFVEPRGGNQEEFETVLKGYYDSVSQGKKPVIRRKRKTKKIDDYVSESAEVTNLGGAAFLAVFRGKVSEGIDFSDDKARVVIAVGIPFPNMYVFSVVDRIKKKYNNTYRSSKNLLSGNEWYCQQAFRSLNQALGRCIRHRYDYGAIILLDWRFQDEKNRAYISKWLRPSIRMYGSFEKSLDELRSFFSEVKDLVAKNKQLSSLAKYDISFTQLKPQSDVGAQPSMQADKDEKTCNGCIDLVCDSPKDSQCFVPSSMKFANEDRDLLMVQEMPFVNTGITLASPGSLTRDGSSGSTIIQASTKCPDQFLFHPMSTSLNEVPSVCESETIVTPEKDVDQNKAGVIPGEESPFNLSVCSYTQKRRKSVASTFINLVDEDTSAQIPGSMNSEGLAHGDMLRRIEFGFETSSAENDYQESNVPFPLATDNTIFSCPVMDKRQQISCLLCRSPLGRPENNLYIMFSLTVSSKVYLLSLFKERLISCDSNMPPTVPVIITDISSVDPRLSNGTLQGDREQGIWHEEDGCVFKKVFCPFCSNPNNCLGVQIKAADEKNVQLLNKIMLYHGSVVIRNSEATEDRAEKDEIKSSSTKKTAILNSIEKFAYSSQQSGLGGWRTTKSKAAIMDLPYPSLTYAAEDAVLLCSQKNSYDLIHEEEGEFEVAVWETKSPSLGCKVVCFGLPFYFDAEADNVLFPDDLGEGISGKHGYMIQTNKPEKKIAANTCSKTSSGDWDWERLKIYFPGPICDTIAAVCPPTPGLGDYMPGWRWEVNHSFSVKSAYKALSPEPWPTAPIRWMKVWTFPVPQRIRVFLWISLHGRLLTNAERMRRHIAVSAWCPLSLSEDEDISHALRRCSFALGVWRTVLGRDDLPTFLTLPMEDWLLKGLSGRGKLPWNGTKGAMYFAVVCWKLWKRRSKLVFQNEEGRGDFVENCIRLKNDFVANMEKEPGGGRLYKPTVRWRKTKCSVGESKRIPLPGLETQVFQVRAEYPNQLD
ncbi:hypothetical protein F3Y22_tig00110163pilonHSYRG00265 [Hibiscus syriacus]|uniref:DNA 5'-3' helicase FANCJ n=1 Tax=Hibiscus syriacus TaxID=106335 RepID=A0A6A3BLA0_HIBSY|nr:hypothetical protein F3Y22_tig00110163pilonHSYRG00265 [Hibiscus syriacus]